METIIAAVDFNDATESILNIARKLGRAFGSQIYILHVEPPEPDFVGFDPGPQHVRDNVAQDVIEDHDRAHFMAERLRSEGLNAQSLVIQGPTAKKIVEEAQRLGADLIIAGGHRHGKLHDLLVGSDSSGILRAATCPVLVVPQPVSEN